MKGKGRADGRSHTSKAVAAEEAAKREAELKAMFVIVPPGDEAKAISCPICKEPLKSEFLEDDEEWVWRNAILKDERVSLYCNRAVMCIRLICVAHLDIPCNVSRRGYRVEVESCIAIEK